MKKKVLLLCTYNSARSQLAEGILKHLGKDKFEVKSAGIYPTKINPLTIEVMEEIGIDVREQYSKSISQFKDEEFYYVISVCDKARQVCPNFFGNYIKIHWSIKDPVQDKNQKIAFRKTRNVLKALIIDFLKEELNYANLRCPFCKIIQKVEIPLNNCLTFYKCINCDKLISTPEGSCCLICGYSDKVCREFLEKTIKEYIKE
jgi:arsenate reductase